MKDDSYLYGENVEVMPIPDEVINSRVRDLKSHRDYLIKDGMMKADSVRLNRVIEAIKFWETINKKH